MGLGGRGVTDEKGGSRKRTPDPPPGHAYEMGMKININPNFEFLPTMLRGNPSKSNTLPCSCLWDCIDNH